ncbi:MAG: ABC transporter ATP-binding protein, partial [Clostridium sp.]
MGNNVAVEVCNLDVEYDKVKILNNINLNIKEGEIIGLLGPSGSGKTTLVKTIIGMKGFVKGKVVVLDEKMPTLKVVNDIGYMAQSDALYDDLTGIDNVLFFAELYGIKGKIAKQRAMEVLELVDLQKHAKRPVKNYSGGMKRRLSLAIALVHSPKLLILDEPTVGIDPILRKKFWDEFNRIKNSGGTIIVTTHVMDEAY